MNDTTVDSSIYTFQATTEITSQETIKTITSDRSTIAIEETTFQTSELTERETLMDTVTTNTMATVGVATLAKVTGKKNERSSYL